MRETILSGFLIRNVSDLADLELIIAEMKKRAEKRASAAYAELVRWQTERIVDEIALNRLKRPERESILDMAAGEVRRRVFYAERTMQNTEFCLYAGLQVMSGKINGKPAVYFKIMSPNSMYDKVLRKVKELEPYAVTTDDLENPKGEKAQFYSALLEKYENEMPLSCSLINYDELSFKPDEMKFRSPSERAGDIATEQVLSHLLSCYACDQEIPPNKLIEYSSFAFNRVKYEGFSEAIAFEKDRLSKILPEIDFELVSKTGMMSPVAPDDVPAKNDCEENCSDDANPASESVPTQEDAAETE